MKPADIVKAKGAVMTAQPGPQYAFLSTVADIAIFGGAAGGGKMLPLTTPLPTPSGWTTMGDVKVGDVVFDEKGNPCNVTAVHPIKKGPVSYKLTFSDGVEQLACADHEWLTFDTAELAALTRLDPEWRAARRARRPSKVSGRRSDRFAASLAKRNAERSYVVKPAPEGTVRTTAEIAASLRTESGRTNHAIPFAKPLELPDADLPIDPYVLGAWLGDGTVVTGVLTTADDQMVEYVRTAGYEVEKQPSNRYAYRIAGFTRLLKDNGLLGNKHVPQRYLRASFRQRLALLQGLMDTDGHACESGACEFMTTIESLRDGMSELLATLGVKSNWTEGRATLDGRDCGPKWRFKFATALKAFRLDRKIAIQKPATRRTTAFRYIVACDSVDSVPMRCITVDSPKHLYLCGRHMVPTHNSYAILLEATRHTKVPGFGAVIFRRTLADVKKEGSLWDTSVLLYGPFAKPRLDTLSWTFPARTKVTFSHLEHEKNVLDWQGAQIPCIIFDELTHFCVTPDTEVLTSDGWKPIPAVRKGESVVSFSDDRRAVVETVVDTPSFDFDGELVSTESRNGVSFRVTPNHRMVVDRQDEAGSWGFMTADRVSNTSQMIPRVGKWEAIDRDEPVVLDVASGRGCGSNVNSAESIEIDDYLEFLGWYLSEGSAFLASKSRGGTSPCVSIRQTKPCPTLDDLMARLPYRVRSDGDGGYRLFSRQLYDHLKPLGDRYQKRIPRWVFSLSARQQRILFDAFMLGDGARTKSGGWAVGLCNEGLIDDLQEMAFYCGLVATKGYQFVKDQFHVHRLTVSPNRKSSQVRKGTVEHERYSGKVHCLTVTGTGTFLMRHRGRCCWTGNSRKQFFYMLSRNRSTCGVTPYIRATCNPDSDSWVAGLISWWIDQDTGFAIPERSGVIRWFVRAGDELRWADTKEELLIDYPDSMPKSLTFISSKLTDNKILMDADPGYRANLLALDRVERERLLNGNWKVRPSSGLYFQRHWCEIVDTIPAGTRFVRGWDTAATPKTEQNDPDWTCGTKIGRCPDGRYIVADHVYFQGAPLRVESAVLNTANADGRECRIHMPQDPAAAGKAQKEVYQRLLAGFNARFAVATGDKITRFSGFSAQADPGSSGGHGNVIVLRGPWNDRWFSQLEGFPEGKHDDDADATAEAFNGLVGKWGPGEALLEATREANRNREKAKPEEKLITYALGSVEFERIMDSAEP